MLSEWPRNQFNIKIILLHLYHVYQSSSLERKYKQLQPSDIENVKG